MGKPEQPQQQESPYTPFESNEDYVRAGYGAEGYQPAAPVDDHQPDYYTPPAPAPAAAHPRGVAEEGPPPSQEAGGMKEKLREKLGPCLGHRPASHEHQQHEAHESKGPGVMDKVQQSNSDNKRNLAWDQHMRKFTNRGNKTMPLQPPTDEMAPRMTKDNAYCMKRLLF
ncbi:hypothetical protein GOP47_0024796 [Adiantum capillus-veneris]|uniref:Uncharacterized protein n=1 Tax=Adiantum capillus-veneris TaxID=13818 RepID=A0A9D4U531_ADICA|nr:hypothetical protein GOP47_0024796 [Adiantum capillus-veneris]